LGDFSSILCFKAAITGIEDALREKATAIALTSAGPARGNKLAEELGLVGSSMSLDDAASKLNMALGKDGTGLCIVERIIAKGENIKVYTSETFCSGGSPPNSPRKCTFTMAAVWGAIEQLIGKRFKGVHSECLLRGGTHDVFEFIPFE
jgi:hypothetical protein